MGKAGAGGEDFIQKVQQRTMEKRKEEEKTHPTRIGSHAPSN
jgi:hypothetical protein